MSKLGYAVRSFAEVMRYPLPLKRARQFLVAWTLSLTLNVLTLSTGVMFGGAFSITLGLLTLAVNAAGLRNAVVRYVNAKRQAEREAFVRAMFEEWSR